MLKDFLRAYAVAVLVATIITTALWIVGADSTALQVAMEKTPALGATTAIAYALTKECNRF